MKLSAFTQQELDNLFNKTPAGQKINSFKIALLEEGFDPNDDNLKIQYIKSSDTVDCEMSIHLSDESTKFKIKIQNKAINQEGWVGDSPWFVSTKPNRHKPHYVESYSLPSLKDAIRRMVIVIFQEN